MSGDAISNLLLGHRTAFDLLTAACRPGARIVDAGA